MTGLTLSEAAHDPEKGPAERDITHEDRKLTESELEAAGLGRGRRELLRVTLPIDSDVLIAIVKATASKYGGVHADGDSDALWLSIPEAAPAPSDVRAVDERVGLAVDLMTAAYAERSER